MEFTFKRTVNLVAWLLIAAAVSQPVYTALYLGAPDIDRSFLWGMEALIFTVLAAFAGSALAQASRLHLVWSAIAASAVLNLVQVGVGLTMFGAFRAASTAVPDMAPATAGVVAFSFMVYNAAKVLLALALLVIGLAKLGAGSKALGGLSVLVGVIAFASNTLSMALGRGFIELPIAGGSGVLATVLLAVCLFGQSNEE